MSTGTGIQWTDATWNPVVGCTPVSSGCLNCYAATMAGTRLANIPAQKATYAGLTVLRNGRQTFNGTVRCLPERLSDPLRWRKPRMVFVNSMSDLFHEDVPFEFVDKVFAVMALCPQHTFQVLTKRPERMANYLNASRDPVRKIGDAAFDVGPGNASERADRAEAIEWHWHWPLENVWLGTSCENQETADERIPNLLKCPAAVRFLSCEPLLGPIDLFCNARVGGGQRWNVLKSDPGVHWVIVGGESGPHARPCPVEGVRSIVSQCTAAGRPVFVKQLGKWISGPHDFDGWQGVIDRWLLSDGAGKTAVYKRPIFRTEYAPQYYDERPKNAIAWGLNDPKGGRMSEWPADDLRVRQFPPEHRMPVEGEGR